MVSINVPCQGRGPVDLLNVQRSVMTRLARCRLRSHAISFVLDFAPRRIELGDKGWIGYDAVVSEACDAEVAETS